MKMNVLTCGLVAACLVIPTLGFNMEATSSLSFDAEAAKDRPVNKVMTLLKDMLEQLEKEDKDDEDIYDKMACWCETNDKEKTKSISDAEARLSDLESKIEESTAKSASLNAEIKNLESELAENKAALDKATSIRQKQLAEFNEEEKDLLQSAGALKTAVTVLSKNQGSLLQVPRSHFAGIAASVQNVMQKHSSLLYGVLTHSERRAFSAFVQAPEYAPQSGEIFGILNQMKETFENNLASSQKDETANQKAYDELKAAKEDEIKASQNQLDSKTQELADTDEKNAQAREDREDTDSSLAADQKFLAMLKDKCSLSDSEWEERQKTRHEEMEACSKALAVLSSDDAHDLFTKTFNPSFLQKQSAMHSERRMRASNLLSAVAHNLQNPQLAALSMRIRLDAFTRVKQAIDDMATQLLKEKDDEIKKRDFCIGELNKNKLESESLTRDKQDVASKIEDLAMTIKELQQATDQLKAEIAEDQVELKRAGEDREKQAKDFQNTVADQRATQKLLATALNVLQGFYTKKAKVALVQKQDPQAPQGFKPMDKNAAAPGVMGMIEHIISDAKQMEAKAIRSEEDAQKAYKDFVDETNASIEAKGKNVVNKSEHKAKTEAELVETKKDKEAVVTEMEQLANSEAELHSSCDWLMNNFDIRQTARDEEIEALKQAKAILSGAKFEAFVQSF